MELKINQQKKLYEVPPASLADLIALEKKSNDKGIAVALNEQVIPKNDWSKTLLKDQDSILIIIASQGG